MTDTRDATRWININVRKPADCVNVLLIRPGDLYPVVGHRSYFDGEDFWILEEGGDEDREDRQYPMIGGEGWTPTHWMPLPEPPR